MKFEVNKKELENGIVRLDVKIDFAKVEDKKKIVLEKIQKETEIEGFRKGKAPIDVVEKKVEVSKILQESAQEVINEIFPEILKKENLQIIGYPSISVTKLAPGNDFEFSIESSVYPEVELPDYKKIASSVKLEKTEVSKEDIEKVEQNLLNMQNQMLASEKGEEVKEEEKEKDLTDEFVKKLGDFKDVKDFREKLQKDLEKEKENQNNAKKREDIAEAILKEIKMNVPEILVNAELDKIMAQAKDDMERNGQDFNKYLESIKKDQVQFRDSFKTEAEKRAKVEIILKEIAKKEKIMVDKEKMEEQVKNIAKVHGEENIENIKLYVENILINDQVMSFLENQN